MIKVIVITIIVIAAMVFLAWYEILFLLYYQENTADRYALYALVPLSVLILIYFFAERYTHSIKDNRFLDATKSSLVGVGSFALLYFLILVPVISGAILFTNDVFGSKEKITVKGQVTHKLESPGRGAEYELTVKSDMGTITWDTNGIEAKKYSVGDSIELEMTKGFWGLLSKRK